MTEEEEKKKGFPAWAIILLVVVLILFLGFAYFVVQKYRDYRKKEQTMHWFTPSGDKYKNLTQQQICRILRNKIKRDYKRGAFKSHEQFLLAYNQPYQYFHDTTY